jgi:hypothetical protein
MSNELESDRAMVVNLELLEPMLFKLVTTVRHRVAKFDEPAVKITVACFRKFRSLRLYVSFLSAVFVFVTLVFADMIDVDTGSDLQVQCIGTDLPGSTRLFPAIS